MLNEGEGIPLSPNESVCAVNVPGLNIQGLRGDCFVVKQSELPIGVVVDPHCDLSQTEPTEWVVCVNGPDGYILLNESDELTCCVSGGESPYCGPYGSSSSMSSSSSKSSSSMSSSSSSSKSSSSKSSSSKSSSSKSSSSKSSSSKSSSSKSSSSKSSSSKSSSSTPIDTDCCPIKKCIDIGDPRFIDISCEDLTYDCGNVIWKEIGCTATTGGDCYYVTGVWIPGPECPSGCYYDLDYTDCVYP
jgi:hypothetical protein